MLIHVADKTKCRAGASWLGQVGEFEFANLPPQFQIAADDIE